MSIETDIRRVFASTLKDQGSEEKLDLSSESLLLETGLDSLGFAILVTKLEDHFGYDPFTLMDTPYYPRTFGEFVEVYEKYAPS